MGSFDIYAKFLFFWRRPYDHRIGPPHGELEPKMWKKRVHQRSEIVKIRLFDA